MVWINKFGFTYLNYKANYSFQTIKLFLLFRIADPVMHYLFYAALVSSIVGTDYLKYVVVGNIAYYTCQTMLLNFLNMFRTERHYGTLELNVASPTSTFLIILRKGIVPLLDGLFVFIVGLVAGSLLFGIGIPYERLGELLLLFIVTLFSILSFSLLFGAVGLVFANANLFLNLSLGFFQVLCGVNFPVTLLPDALETLARFMPLTNSIEALRTIYSLEHFDVYSLLGKEALIGICYLFFSAVLISLMEKLARRNGALFKNI